LLHNAMSMSYKDGWDSVAAEAYDIATDSWTRIKDIPVPGQASAVSVPELDKAFVLCHGDSVYEYNIDGNTYTKLSTLPIPEWHCFECISVGPFIFLIGGMSGGKYLDICRVFDARDNSWWELPNLLRQRRRSAAAGMILS
jgi:hypothetical protein